MRRTSFADMHCSIGQSLEVMGDWWSPLILRDLYLGVDRFDDLVADLGLSRNILTTRLDDLIAGGVVSREQYQANPPRHRYRLTTAGHELVPVLMALAAWGDRWAQPAGGPPVLFRHRGHECVPTVACSVCAQPLVSDEVEPVRGPGAGQGPGTMVIGRFGAGE